LAALVVSSVASAAPPRAAVELALAGIERAPTAESIRRLGAGADLVLIEIADDPATTPIRRARAIRAMQWAPSSSVRAYLHDLIATRGAATRGMDVLELGAALVSLAPYGAQELPLVLRFVAHASADVRQGAAIALGTLGGAEALAALRARSAVERDAGVREAIARGLDRLAR
jgi:hypothetical protein